LEQQSRGSGTCVSSETAVGRDSACENMTYTGGAEKNIGLMTRTVLPENIAMLTVFSRSGLPMEKKFKDGADHVTLSLTGEKSCSAA